jgi:hypothetical protein
MARIPVFYSFHYGNDVFRVQQVRNMGVVDENAPVSPNDWERVKGRGARAIESWIDDNMKYKRCVVVLVGEETAERRYVKYEIAKAWKDDRGLFGIYIHNLKDPKTGTCRKGPNPFSNFTVGERPLSDYVRCYDPGSNPYTEIAQNLDHWVALAIEDAKTRS